jgi:CubicO group peptidase (beta-lactamase class C family)
MQSMKYLKDLDLVLQEIMAGWDVPGMAIGIVKGDEIVYAKGFGVQSLETLAPVTLDTVFCVQSISKCFVATAVMQLVESGKLDLDAPLVQYLPYFRLDDERFRQITIRQALSHTSGMPDMDESEYIELVAHPEYDEGSAERYVRALSSKKLVANPGERFSYSNIAYNVLGDLLAKVSAQSFESAICEQVLIRSGMPHSTFVPKDIPTHLLAWPHLRSPEMKVNPSYPYHRADAPASFLHSTVVELCHWGITSLRRGNYLGHNLLSAAGYDLMWTPVAKRGNPPNLYEEMGLGWTLGHFKGVKTICHGGAGFGATSFLLILPENNSSAVLLCNEESDAHYLAIQAVADALIDQQPQADKVSAMVQVSRALAGGGLDAASTLCSELKAGKMQDYNFDEFTLGSLALQLRMARQPDLAIEVLGLNIHFYPDHMESYLEQAKLFLQRNALAQAKEVLLKALSIEPDNTAAVSLLEIKQ